MTAISKLVCSLFPGLLPWGNCFPILPSTPVSVDETAGLPGVLQPPTQGDLRLHQVREPLLRVVLNPPHHHKVHLPHVQSQVPGGGQPQEEQGSREDPAVKREINDGPLICKKKGATKNYIYKYNYLLSIFFRFLYNFL